MVGYSANVLKTSAKPMTKFKRALVTFGLILSLGVLGAVSGTALNSAAQAGGVHTADAADCEQNECGWGDCFVSNDDYNCTETTDWSGCDDVECDSGGE